MVAVFHTFMECICQFKAFINVLVKRYNIRRGIKHFLQTIAIYNNNFFGYLLEPEKGFGELKLALSVVTYHVVAFVDDLFSIGEKPKRIDPVIPP